MKMKALICSLTWTLLSTTCVGRNIKVGDIRLTEDQYNSYNMSEDEESFGKAGLDYLWSNREMPVSFDGTQFRVPQGDKSVVEGTMTEMNQELCGCFRFRPAKPSDIEKVEIQFDPIDGCWSNVGMITGGGNRLNLASGCVRHKGTVQHELLHSAGIWHEQSRPDRDDYVEIHTECIQEGEEHNFKKHISSNTYNLPYNPESIMHYGSEYFTKARGECKTITSKKGVPDDKLGSAEEMTDLDYEKIVKHYRCPANWKSQCQLICNSDFDCFSGQRCEYGICAFQEETFLQSLKDSTMCMVGKPSGKNITYYALVLKCAKNKNQITDECKAIASDCLQKESLLEDTIIEVFADFHSVEEEVPKMNDDDFSQLLTDICVENSAIQSCAYENENQQFTIKCRKLAEDCLAKEDFEKAIQIDETLPTQQQSFREIYQTPFTSLERDLKMQELIKTCKTEHEVQEQWFWNPQTSNACNGYSNANGLTTDFSNECNPTWYSMSWRSKFYQDCLAKISQIVLKQISNFNDHILNNKNTSRNQENVAAVAEVFGPILNDTGIAPREEVLSNTLQFASNSDIVKEVNRTERILKHEIDNMECLLSLYLSSLYEDLNHAISDHDQNATLNNFREGAVSMIGSKITSKTSGDSTVDSYLISKLMNKLVPFGVKLLHSNEKVNGISKLVSQKSKNMSNGLKWISKKKLSPFGKRFKDSLLSINSNSLSFNNGQLIEKLEPFDQTGFEVSNSSNIADFQQKIRDLHYRLNSFIIDYDEIMNGGDIPDEHNMVLPVEMIYGIDVYLKSLDANLKIKIVSGNSSCTTDLFGYSWPSTHMHITSREKLGNCFLFGINGDNTTIHIVNQSNMVVDRVDISTNGRTVPSFRCNETVTLSPNALKCEQSNGLLQRIEFHTNTKYASGSDSALLLDLQINMRKTNQIVGECKDLLIENSGSSKGQILNYYDIDFGECTIPHTKIAEEAYNPNDYKIEVKVTSDGRYNSAWNIDLIKFYFMGESDNENIIFCHPGYGNGAWVIADTDTTFECSFKYPKIKKHSLEAIEVHSCDSMTRGSTSSEIQFTFCNKNFTQAELECAFEEKPCYQSNTAANVLNQCCRTNNFGELNLKSKLRSGKKSKIEGGDKLGPCEGFDMKGSRVFAYVKNGNSDAWCVDQLSFFRKTEDGVQDGQFGHCKFDEVWSDGEVVLRKKDVLWHYYYARYWKPVYTDYSRITCDLTKPKSLLKSITYKLCDNASDSEMSATKFSATFVNEYNNECTIALEKEKSQFVSLDVTDNCKNFEVTEEVSVWIHNGDDALCLSHFYFDNFDIKTAKFNGSYSSIYRCKFDKDAASKNVDTNGIPLLCSASNIVVNYLV